MKAAIVETAGRMPIYGDFIDPQQRQGDVIITVRAAALSNLVRAKAAGTHYTQTPKTAFVPGVDGVGCLDDGSKVYFASPPAPFGAMAERVALPLCQCISLPSAVDDIKIAALVNPGMSSVAALRHRAALKPGETVLVNGATGVSGRLAIQLARRLGAGHVIATGRNRDVLESLHDLGADECIALSENREELDTKLMDLLQMKAVDVVLDYLWGPSMEALFSVIARTGHDDRPIRVVQIGSISASTLSLPAAVLRSTGLAVMGSGIGSVPMAAFIDSIREVIRIESERPLRLEWEAVPLSEVGIHWNRATRGRLVFTTTEANESGKSSES